MEKFIYDACDVSDFLIDSTVFPDIDFSVSQLYFKFTNLHFVSADVPKPIVDFYPDGQQVYLDFQNASGQISFEFKMTQQIYPYIQETGTGMLSIGNLEVASFLYFYSDPDDCPGRMSLDMQNFNLKIQDLNIQLNSTNAWLYQGLLTFMTQMIENIFNNDLQSYFKDLIQESVNEGRHNNYGVLFLFDRNDSVVIDQRFIKLNVQDQYMDQQLVGTHCYFHRPTQDEYAICKGHTMQMNNDYELRPSKPTNENLQLFFGNQIFISMFNFLMQNKTMQQILKDCEQPQVVNTGIFVRCMDQNNTQQEFHFQLNIGYQDNGASIMMYLQLYDQQQYQYKQEINDCLYQLSTGINLAQQFDTSSCWNLYTYQQYVSVNCQFE